VGIFEKSLRDLQRIISSADSPLPKEFYCRIQEFFLQHLILNRPPKKDDLVRKILKFCCHFILLMFSIRTIIISRIKGLKIAHYIILIKNQKKAAHDFRSDEIIEILPLSHTVNFSHCASLKEAFTFIGKIPNLVFLDSVLFFVPVIGHIQIPEFNGLDDKNREKIAAFWPTLNKSRSRIGLLAFLLRFLRLQKFVMLDDSRHTCELRVACKKLGTTSIGYMHGRFNEYHMGLFYNPFDKYFVWSEYFKDLFLKLTPEANAANIFVAGHFRIKDKLPLASQASRNGLKVLFLGESNVSFEDVKPYLEEISKAGDISVVFRGKPGNLDASAVKFINNLKIPFDTSGGFIEALTANQYDLVLGTHSTALMECFLQGTPGLVLATTYDYATQLVSEKRVFGCDSPQNIVNTIRKISRFPRTEIQDMSIKLWGQDYCFKPSILKGHLLN
jgi:hypothetical protein